MASLHQTVSVALGRIYGGSIADNDDAAVKVLRAIYDGGFQFGIAGPLTSKPDPARDGAQPLPTNLVTTPLT